MPTMMTRVFLAVMSAVIVATSASATSLQQIARLEEQGESVLQGLGLVVGLPGTGDSAEDLIVARPLFTMLEAMGNAPGSLEELAEANSAALVVVTCTIPEGGARVNDRFDVTVSAINNAESLAGGELFLTWSRIYSPAGITIHRQGVMPTICTSTGLEDAERIIGLFRTGELQPSPSLRAYRHVAADDEDALAALRAFCPWRAHDEELDVVVAERLLEQPELYALALRASGPEALAQR